MGVRFAATLACFCVVSFVAPAPAYAGNDDSLLIGDNAALMGGAVTAITDTGAALWYNPAGLANVHRDTVDVSGSAYALRLYRIPELLRMFSGETSDGHINEVLVVPTAVTYVRPFRRASVGFGVFVGESFDATIRSQVERADPGNAKEWLLTISSEVERYHFVAGAAWSPSHKLNIGFGVHGILASESVSSQFAGGNQDRGNDFTSSVFVTGSQSSSGTGLGFAGSFGVQWRPTDRIALGASILSPVTLFYRSASVSSVASVAELTAPAVGVFDTDDSSISELAIQLLLPARLRFGLAYTHPNWTLSFDGDIQHPLRNADLAVDRKFVWNARVGAKFHATDTVDVGFGLFTDRSAAQPVNELAEFDLDFYGFSLGASFFNDKRLDAGVEKADKLTFGTTVAFRYAYGRGDVGGLLLTDDFADLSASLLARRTKITVHELAIYLGTEFLF